MSPGATHPFVPPLPLGGSGFAPPSALQPSVVQDHRGVETSIPSHERSFIQQFYSCHNSHQSPFPPTNADFALAAGDESLQSHQQLSESERISSFQVRTSSSFPPAQFQPLHSNQSQRLPQNSAMQPQTMGELDQWGFQLDRDRVDIENTSGPNLSASNEPPSSHTISLDSFDPSISSSNGSYEASSRTCFLRRRDSRHDEAVKYVYQKLTNTEFAKLSDITRGGSLSSWLFDFYQKWARPSTQAKQPTNDVLRDTVIERVDVIVRKRKTPSNECRDIVNGVDFLYGGLGWVPKEDRDSAIGSPELSQPRTSTRRRRTRSNDNSVNPSRPPKKRRGYPNPTAQRNGSQDTSSGACNDGSLSSVEPAKPRREPCQECKEYFSVKNLPRHRTETHYTEVLFFCPLIKNGKQCRNKFVRKGNLMTHIEAEWKLSNAEDLEVEVREKIKEVIPNFCFQVPKRYPQDYHKICPHCGPSYPDSEFPNCQKSIEHEVDHYTSDEPIAFWFGGYDHEVYSHQDLDNYYQKQRLFDAELAAFATTWKGLSGLDIDYLIRLNGSHRVERLSLGNGTGDPDKDDDYQGGNSSHDYPGRPNRGHGGGRGGGRGGEGGGGGGGGGSSWNGDNGGNSGRYNNPPSGSGYASHQNRSQNANGFRRQLYTPFSVDGKELCSCYKSVRELGRGGFGVVDEVKCRHTGQRWARKSIPLRFRISSNVQSEVSIMRTLSHSHIIRLEGSYINRSRVCLFMSPVAERDLATFLGDLSLRRENSQQDPSQHERKQMRKWVTCLTSAVDYLHEKGIVHGDIKPKNVLIDSSEIFLTDFGFSIDKNLPEKTPISARGWTPKYSPPEVTKSPTTRQTGGSAADIFSLGCVYAEMATVYSGQTIKAFESFRSLGTGDTAFRNSILKNHLWLDSLVVPSDTGPGCPYNFLELVKSMLSFNPSSRPTVRELVIRFQKFWPSESVPKDTKENRKTNASCPCERAQHVEEIPPAKKALPRPNQAWGTTYQEGLSYEFCDSKFGLWLADVSNKTYLGLLFEIKTPTVQLWDSTSGTWTLSTDKNKAMFSTFILITFHTNEEVLSLYSKLASRQLGEAPIFLTPRLIATNDESNHKAFQGFYTLKDYFQATPPPTSARDTIQLWSSVLGLFESRKWHKRLWLMRITHVAVSRFLTKREIVLVHEIKGKSPYAWNFGLSNLETGSNCNLLSDRRMPLEKLQYRKKSLAPQYLSDLYFFGIVLIEVVKWIFQNPKKSLLEGGGIMECYPTPPIFPVSNETPKLDGELFISHVLESQRLGADSVTKEICKHVIMPLFLPLRPPFSHLPTLDDYSTVAWGVLQDNWQQHSTSAISLTPTPAPTLDDSQKILFPNLKEFRAPRLEEESGKNPPNQNSSVPCQPQLERYIREPADFRCLFVPEYDSMRKASKELHHQLLRSLTKLDHLLT